MKLSVLYGSEEGKKFQLANVEDVNYRTEENPDSIAKVENSHAYEYDANGNQMMRFNLNLQNPKYRFNMNI